jgi:hypothetical protein
LSDPTAFAPPAVICIDHPNLLYRHVFRLILAEVAELILYEIGGLRYYSFSFYVTHLAKALKWEIHLSALFVLISEENHPIFPSRYASSVLARWVPDQIMNLVTHL